MMPDVNPTTFLYDLAESLIPRPAHTLRPMSKGVLRVEMSNFVFVCRPEELTRDVWLWLADVYEARTAGTPAPAPDPALRVSSHWVVFGATGCNYLWTESAMQKHQANGHDVSALRNPQGC